MSALALFCPPCALHTSLPRPLPIHRIPAGLWPFPGLDLPRRRVCFPHLGTEGICNWKISRVNALFRPQRPDPQPIQDGVTGAHSITNPSARFPWGSRNLCCNLSLNPAWSGLPRPHLLYSQLLSYAPKFPQLAPRHPQASITWPAPTRGTPKAPRCPSRLEKCRTPLPRYLFWSITQGERGSEKPPRFPSVL